MTKRLPKWVYAHRNVKLRKYDILIDLAEIHTISRKMYETGKISKKIIKKWRVRDLKNTYHNSNCEHKWLPEAVFGNKKERQYFNPSKSGWRCVKCHCWCSDLHDDEFKNSGFYCEPYISRQKIARSRVIKAWTDYPLIEKGDIANKEAPIRECVILSYDKDKYCWVLFPDLNNFTIEIKAGYLYSKSGRCGDVPTIPIKRLEKLPEVLPDEFKEASL